MSYPAPIQLVNLDWLSFSVLMARTDKERLEGTTLNTPQGYALREYMGTNMYKRRAILYTLEGDKVLTLLFEPHSKVIHPDSLFCEVANPLLYNGLYKGVLDILMAIHPYSWQSLSRLDICCDFNPSSRQFEIIDMLQEGKAYVQGKREGSMFHTFAQGAKVQRKPKQLSWGAPTTDIKYKLYNKSLEIYQPDSKGRTWCSKPYIATEWRKNALDERNVWRLEVSIMGSSSYTWHDEKLAWHTTQRDNFEPLYYDLCATRWVVRKNEGHKYKKYDTILPFLAIPDTPHVRLRAVPPVNEVHHTDHAVTLRALMKELDRDEVRCNKLIRDNLLHSTMSVIAAANLDGYFYRCTGKNFDEWAAEYIDNCP